MRTFKFRVWDGRSFLNSDEFCLFPEDDGTFSAMYLGSYGQMLSIPKATVQQFSGMLDKNGREIFEGDILKKYSEYYNCSVHLEVQFLKGVFGIYFGPPDEIPYPLIESEKHFEVIGNIFENPDIMVNL